MAAVNDQFILPTYEEYKPILDVIDKQILQEKIKNDPFDPTLFPVHKSNKPSNKIYNVPNMVNILYITVHTIDVWKQYIKLNNNHLLLTKIPRRADETYLQYEAKLDLSQIEVDNVLTNYNLIAIDHNIDEKFQKMPWIVDNDGYVKTYNIKKKQSILANIILENHIPPDEPGRMAYHINHNKLDCRLSNLRWMNDHEEEQHILSYGPIKYVVILDDHSSVSN